MTETRIDPEAWEQMKSMAEPAFLAELIDVFLADSPALIEQMRASLPTGDVEGLRRAAHSLKSNSASFGATRLAGLAREVEMMARSGALDGAGPKLDELAAEYDDLVPVLLEKKDEQ